MNTLILVPTYNEAKNVIAMLTQLIELDESFDVLVIDDGSPDGTAELVEEFAKSNSRVSLMRRKSKAGLGAAYIAGFEYGLAKKYEYLVEMDADGSHRTEDLPGLLAAAKHADLVIGSRWIPGGAVSNWAWYRQAISQIGNSYASFMLGCQLRDMTSGFRVFRAHLLRKIPLGKVQAQGYGFQIEMAWRSYKAGAKISEVPILFIERELGKSKMNSLIVLEALLLVSKWGLQRLIKRS